MRVQKTRTVTKEVEEVIEDFRVCDKCGDKIVVGHFDAFIFDFEVRFGDYFPEGGSGSKWTMDLCQVCAERLISDLQNNGYNIQELNWER